MAYCTSRFRTVRRETREVRVGAVGVGGANPVRIQSMTTSDTQDVPATVRQSIALAEAGCEIVRVTAPNVAAAKCLAEIRARFSAAGFAAVPLVADIHFLPAAAMEAVEHVEKVRVNPGNYADKKRFAVREYSDAAYAAELERLHEAFSPLVRRSRELGRALRIGTNHGSLSDRILNRYGDTPLGMVESALEFIRIAESHDFRDIILSMKASNPKVMIQAYRLLVERMTAEGMPYPLHLGVTEAGDGEDGRIKSAIGIGSLLLDGLGDTIRVSLTEDSVYEIPVARALAGKAMRLWSTEARSAEPPDAIDPYRFSRRPVAPLELAPGLSVDAGRPPRVLLHAGDAPADPAALAARLAAARPQLKDTPIEGVVVRAATAGGVARIPELARALAGVVECLVVELDGEAGLGSPFPAPGEGSPTIAVLRRFGADDATALADFLDGAAVEGFLPVLALEAGAVPALAQALRTRADRPWIATLDAARPFVPHRDHPVGAWRRLIEALRRHELAPPLWIRSTPTTALADEPAFLSRLLEASLLAGPLLTDGAGDLLSVETEADPVRATRLAYNILQGAGARISKTEFVACPSCGRTLFDLQTTTQRIREQTGHLKGVKLAIMGCIVNGPGEMADADFGYVGGAPGRINLYVGKTCVQYNIPQAEADRRLIELIKAHGKWVDPEPAPAGV